MEYSVNKCSIEGCNNKRHNRGGGYLHPLCDKHHHEKYGYNRSGRFKASSKERFKKKYRGVPCSVCGWNKAPCDIHRIIPGKDGGRYTTDNVVVLCPNCHRIEHRKVI